MFFPSMSVLVLALASATGCGPDEPAKSGADTGGESDAHPLAQKPAPDFAGDVVNGKGKQSFAANKGKVLIVDFWATWCEPCKKSFPKLQEIYVKYKGQIEIVAISEDEENNGLKDFGDANGSVKFPIIWDKDKAMAGKWQPSKMPSTFIIDKSGVIRFVHLGYHDGEELVIEKQLKSLL
jgi:thiol-disulfide isomerase/thioredoxin